MLQELRIKSRLIIRSDIVSQFSSTVSNVIILWANVGGIRNHRKTLVLERSCNRSRLIIGGMVSRPVFVYLRIYICEFVFVYLHICKYM